LTHQSSFRIWKKNMFEEINIYITQQYSHINTRFDLLDEELDNDNSSARLFERSRIKALAGEWPSASVAVVLNLGVARHWEGVARCLQALRS
uniref:Uncharacterized protein n=1 Tax=Gouania willdenowi TaxID=441366 RepID=A0A8C5I8J5_GOUWI